MGIRKYKPTTPGLRGMTVSTFEEITATSPEKSLTKTLKKHAGRNNRGMITVRHQGGGNRRKYRIIDFKRNKDDIAATVKTIEYDPNRSANIALVCYADGEKRYIIAPDGLKVGDVIYSGAAADSMAAAMSSNGQYLLPITEYDWFTEEENVVGVAAAGYSDGLTYYVTDSEKAMVEPDEHLKSSDIKGKGFFLRFDFSCLNDYEDMMGPEENKVLQKLASGLDCMEAYYEGSGKCVFRLSAKGSKSIAEVFGGIVKMFM